MLLAFNLLIIIYPYPITSGLLWKELYLVRFRNFLARLVNLKTSISFFSKAFFSANNSVATFLNSISHNSPNRS
nr:hypothetical protein [Wolbachia endosymbiont (group A) of Sphecodes monilicornis]